MEGDTELAKELGLLAALTIGIGTMIGAGIFVLPGAVASEAGPAAALAFTVAGFIALFTALSISELGTAMPKAGGGYYYINDALGPMFGSIAGWGNWLGLAFATAFYMIGFGSYARIYLPIPEVLFLDPSQVAALLAALVFTGINYYGAKETGRVQVIIVTILVVVLTIFSIVGLFHIDWSNLQPFAPAETGGYSAVLPAAGLIFVTYLGFAEINTVAEELKNPGRNLPLAVIGSLLFVIAFYAIIMIILMGVEPYTQVAGYGEEAVARVAESMMGALGLLLLTFGGLLATASSANASILASSRINFAMGRDKIITDWINEVHPKFATPYRSIAITGALILLFILIGDVETLAKAGSVLHLIVYGLLNIALIVYRESETIRYEPDFEVPFYPIVPALGAILSFALIGFMAPIEILLSVGFVVFGIIWYAFYAKNHAEARSLVGEAIAPNPNGGQETRDTYRVVVPIANPESQRNLVRLASASAASSADSGTPEVVAVNVIEVPQQTSLKQKVQFEEERIERQRALLESARESTTEIGANFRTRAVVGRDAGQVLLNIIEEEEADQVILGWAGGRSKREYVFGSTIDPVVQNAPCDVSLINSKDERIGKTIALAGPGPNASVAARRAFEITTLEGTKPTLLNVQQPSDDPNIDVDPIKRGKTRIDEVATAAGMEPDEYESEVLVADEIHSAILDKVDHYETVCFGMSEQTAISRTIYGSVAKQVSQHAQGNVIMVRGRYQTSRTVRQAIAERLLR
jgi:basic amino acid/polyamine antiporter, APA family